ncbi:MAG: hypothetical protein OEZ38_12805 [Gammaproteobacteria bacterium]|nr:hypothetical protein [Gammaproteobacteria bacterium]
MNKQQYYTVTFKHSNNRRLTATVDSLDDFFAFDMRHRGKYFFNQHMEVINMYENTKDDMYFYHGNYRYNHDNIKSVYFYKIELTEELSYIINMYELAINSHHEFDIHDNYQMYIKHPNFEILYRTIIKSQCNVTADVLEAMINL